jgi:hypothetical protein
VTSLQIANRVAHPLWSMLVGLVILGVLSLVPVLGGLVLMIAAMFGLGGLVFTAMLAYQKPPLATSAPTPAPLPVAA